MSKTAKTLVIIVLTIIFFIMIVAAIYTKVTFNKIENMPYVDDDYYKTVEAKEPFEIKYTNIGPSSVTVKEYEVDDEKVGKYTVCYPSELENDNKRYPMVLFVNTSNLKADKYIGILKHLASWGFITVANDDINSWEGYSARDMLSFMVGENVTNDSIFYGKIDTANIGISGHSQGAIGAVNAITSPINKQIVKAAYISSIINQELADSANWSYDIYKVNTNIFMTAGTGEDDSQEYIPLSELQKNYNYIVSDVNKVIARRKDTEHMEMLKNADGYMTAWFMWQLQNDIDAGNVFEGKYAEILSNPNWQDVQKSF